MLPYCDKCDRRHCLSQGCKQADMKKCSICKCRAHGNKRCSIAEPGGGSCDCVGPSKRKITDKERIDWLQKEVVSVVESGHGYWFVNSSKFNFAKGRTYRQAIDAAIRTSNRYFPSLKKAPIVNRNTAIKFIQELSGKKK